jgi:hypothetical protein
MQIPKKALIFAPLVPGVIWSLLVVNPFFIFIAAPLGYFGALVFGFPLYLLALRYWKISVLSCLICGATTGILTGLVFTWLAIPSEAPFLLNGGGVAFAILGSISGLSFWKLGGAQQGTPAEVHASRGRA